MFISYMSLGNFTCLEVIFVLKRRLGYYLFHTYVPTCLIVIMSVSFKNLKRFIQDIYFLFHNKLPFVTHARFSHFYPDASQPR